MIEGLSFQNAVFAIFAFMRTDNVLWFAFKMETMDVTEKTLGKIGTKTHGIANSTRIILR